MSRSGQTRPLVVGALALAVAVLAGSLWYLATSGAVDDVDGGGGDGVGDPAGEPSELPLGGGQGTRRPVHRAGSGAGDEADEGEDPADPDGDGIVEWGRDPNGETFEVTPDTLRDMIARNVWEEACRQIQELERLGRPIPADIIRSLLALIPDEGRRLDAVQALGLIHDPVAGQLLADLATDASRPEAERVAALEALSRSGQNAGFAQVRAIVDAEGAGDTALVRRAYLALASMGGRDGTDVLLGALAAHGEDDHTDIVLTALAKLRDGDGALAQSLRDAKRTGDVKALDLLLRVGTRVGGAAGNEMRAEIRSLVESTAALAALESDPNEQERLRVSAIYVASAMGGDALDAVIRLIDSETGSVRQSAVNSLRLARGDAAADRISTLLRPGTDTATRFEIASALGGTQSAKAAPALHALLDDPEPRVREVAAAGLASARSQDSVPVILARLDAAKGSHGMAVSFVRALGQIGSKDAIPKLEEIAGSKDEAWGYVRPYAIRAIQDIRRGGGVAPPVDR